MSGTVEEYKGSLKTLSENSYGDAIGIYDPNAKRWKSGCIVSSVAAAARRAEAIAVTYTTTLPESQVTAVKGAAESLTSSDLGKAMQEVRDGDASLSSVVAPQVASVEGVTSITDDETSTTDGIAAESVKYLVLAGVFISMIFVCFYAVSAHHSKKLNSNEKFHDHGIGLMSSPRGYQEPMLTEKTEWPFETNSSPRAGDGYRNDQEFSDIHYVAM